VIGDDRQDRDRPQSIDVGTIFHAAARLVSSNALKDGCWQVHVSAARCGAFFAIKVSGRVKFR
jgi:hypothetical protein